MVNDGGVGSETRAGVVEPTKLFERLLPLLFELSVNGNHQSLLPSPIGSPLRYRQFDIPPSERNTMLGSPCTLS